MRSTAHEQYRSQRVTTASPAELVAMMYDASVAQMRLARDAIVEGRTLGAHGPLVKSQDLVTELRCSLNLTDGGDLARRLDAIYDYVLQLLVRANVSRDTRALDDAIRLIDPLREAWREACLSGPVPATAAAIA